MENRFEEAESILRQLGYVGGLTFDEQVRKIDEVLKRQPALPAGERNTGDRASGYCEVLAATLREVQAATTLIELQHNLVILNVNEFKLRFHPSVNQFLSLLSDFEAWELRWRNRWTGTLEVICKAEELLRQVIAAAKEKYNELAMVS